MSSASQRVLELKKKAALKRIQEGRASDADYRLIGQTPPVKPLGTVQDSGRVKLTTQEEVGEQRKQKAKELAEATKKTPQARRTQALKEAVEKERQTYVQNVSQKRSKTFYQGGKAPDPEESKKSFVLHPDLKAPLASDEARKGMQERLQKEHEERLKKIGEAQKTKQAQTVKGKYLSDRDVQRQKYIKQGYSSKFITAEKRKQEIDRLEKFIKEVEGYGTSRISSRKYQEFTKAKQDLSVLKSGGLPKKRQRYGAFGWYFADTDASDPTLADLQFRLTKLENPHHHITNKEWQEKEYLKKKIADREETLKQIRGEEFNKLYPIRTFTPEEEAEFETFAAEATNATDKEIKDFENRKISDIADQVGGLSSLLEKSDPTLSFPKAEGFQQKQFFKDDSQDEADADTFLKLGEKFGISSESIKELEEEQEKWFEDYRDNLNALNETGLEAKKALLEAERIRHEESMRKAKDKAREILETADEKTNVILARFGAGNSTAAAALYIGNRRVFQEAISALDTEDSVFNQQMLAKNLQAQAEFDSKSLEIEKKYLEDKNKMTSKKLELAMDYFKEFLTYRDKKQSERYKVAELFMKEGLRYAENLRKDRMKSAFDLFDEYGSQSLPAIQDTLREFGIDVSSLEGIKTFKELKTQYDINKPYYNPNTGTGGQGFDGSPISGTAREIAHSIQTGTLDPYGITEAILQQSGSELLAEFGRDFDEALYLTNAAPFIEKYKDKGLFNLKEGESTQKSLIEMIDPMIGEPIIDFLPPGEESEFMESVKNELDAQNSRYAPINGFDISNYVRKVIKGVPWGLRATPKYYETFDEVNDAQGITSVDIKQSIENMGIAGQKYAKDAFGELPTETIDPSRGRNFFERLMLHSIKLNPLFQIPLVHDYFIRPMAEEAPQWFEKDITRKPTPQSLADPLNEFELEPTTGENKYYNPSYLNR